MKIKHFIDNASSFLLEPNKRERTSARRRIAWATTIAAGFLTLGIIHGLSFAWRKARRIPTEKSPHKATNIFQNVHPSTEQAHQPKVNSIISQIESKNPENEKAKETVAENIASAIDTEKQSPPKKTENSVASKPLSDSDESIIGLLALDPLNQQPIETCRERFDALSQNQKQQLRKKFERAYDGYSSTHPLDDECIACVDEISAAIFQVENNAHFFSLGQSPAFFMEMERARHPEKSGRLQYIPFSGDWHGIMHGKDELTIDYPGKEKSESNRKAIEIDNSNLIAPDDRLIEMKDSIPSEQQVNCLRSYLKRIGLDPIAIVNREEPSIIIDYIQRGAGLYSFLTIIYNWAVELGIPKEAIKQKLRLELISQTAVTMGIYKKNAFLEYIALNFGPLCSSYRGHIISSDYRHGIYGTIFDKNQDRWRIVKKCPRSRWIDFTREDFHPFNHENNEEFALNLVRIFDYAGRNKPFSTNFHENFSSAAPNELISS